MNVNVPCSSVNSCQGDQSGLVGGELPGVRSYGKVIQRNLTSSRAYGVHGYSLSVGVPRTRSRWREVQHLGNVSFIDWLSAKVAAEKCRAISRLELVAQKKRIRRASWTPTFW